MKKIGLTSGLGSGKSTVAAVFEALGVPVYYADEAAKKLMSENKELVNKIKNAFGENAYSNGILNRNYLAEVVFNDQEKLAGLNSIVHPATIQDADEWMEKQSSPYVIKEAALLFESGSNKYLNFVIGVSAPLELRVHRAMLRDNNSREQVMQRINKQMNEEEKLRLCDFIIVNDEQQLLFPQVLELHEKFLQVPNEQLSSSGDRS
jgi:dephospho-CoA kinase